MNAAAIIHRLEHYPATLVPLLISMPAEDYRWKPRAEDWSILEVCCHLLDEEKEDFRPRLRSTLEDPAREWPPLDLEKVAERRGYNGRELRQVLAMFVSERAESIIWLRGLKDVDYSRAYAHSSGRKISGMDLLGSWAAHDALHLRQIAKRLHGLAGRDGGDVGYAGDLN